MFPTLDRYFRSFQIVTAALVLSVAWCPGMAGAQQVVFDFVGAPPSSDHAASTPPSPVLNPEHMGTTPLAFTKNEGQWDSQVFFRTSVGSATVWFCRDGIYYQLMHTVAPSQVANERLLTLHPGSFPLSRQNGPDSVEVMLVKAAFVSANSGVEIVGQGELAHRSNYFLGNDSSRWRTDVANYAGILYREIYPGIDATITFANGRLRTRWSAALGATLSQVQFRYEGDATVSVTGTDSVTIEAPWGEVLRLARITVEAEKPEAVINDTGVHPPPETATASSATMVYSTYLGGGDSEFGNAIAVDGSGSAYVTGHTYSADFPTANPMQPTKSLANDVFVAKLNASGSALIYSTFLGGNSGETSAGIAVDGNGNAHIVGHTISTNFPTMNPVQATLSGPYDAFITKLSASGTMVYSTYLGGSDREYGYGIAADGSGNSYVTGVTWSSNFPTSNPFQSTSGGQKDAFVTKLGATGTMEYSTYFGGNADDFSYGIAVDMSSRVHVCGQTGSTDFPIVNAYQATYAGGVDVFISRLNAAGSALEYSTYLGGSSTDVGYALAIDGGGNACVTGETHSNNFPTEDPIQGVSGGLADAIVAKVNSSGALVYSTYLGGSINDYGYAIAADGDGSVHLVGTTSSNDFPTATPLQAVLGGESTDDAFLSKVSASGALLEYSSYLGGTLQDKGMGVAVDGQNNTFVTGYTSSSDFPTVLPLQTANAGGYDAFVAKLAQAQIAVPAKPTIIAVIDAGTGSDLVVKWTQQNTANVTDFEIVYGTSPNVFDLDTLTASADQGTGPYLKRIPGLAEHTPYYVAVRAHNLDAGVWSELTAWPFPAIPNIPLILVYGWRGNQETWNDPNSTEDPQGWLAAAGFSPMWIPDLNPCGGPNESYFDVNASTLATSVQQQINLIVGSTGIPIGRVDVVAHSMGGLVTRRLIGTPGQFGLGAVVRNLIMLGVPNIGTQSALVVCAEHPVRCYDQRDPCIEWSAIRGAIACNGPANCELTPTSLVYFRSHYHEPSYVVMTGVAGTRFEETAEACFANCPLQSPCRGDGVISNQSVRTCDPTFLDHYYERPLVHSTHFADDGTPLTRDISTFTEIVIPTLKGNPPPTPTRVSGSQLDSVRSGIFHSLIIIGDSSTWHDDTLVVESGINLGFTAISLASDVLMELISPNGTTIDSSSSILDSVNYQYSNQLGICQLTVANPILGTWIARIQTNHWTDTVAPVLVLVSIENNIEFTFYNLNPQAELQDSVILHTRLREAGAPVIDATVIVNATSGADTSVFVFSLLDDGSGADEAADDGVYSGKFVGTGIADIYTFSSEASWTGTLGQSLKRVGVLQSYVTGVSRGDINEDSVYDVLDVVGLINYVFRGGLAPYPDLIGDVNCDGVPDILDVVRLIDHVFRGGDQPICQ